MKCHHRGVSTTRFPGEQVFLLNLQEGFFCLLENLFLWQSSANPFTDMWPFPLCLHINGIWKKNIFPPSCSFLGGLCLFGISPAEWHLWYPQFRTSCCVGRAPLWPGKHYICPQGGCSLTRQKGRSGLLLLFARYLFLRIHIFPLSLPGPQIWVPFSHRPCSHLTSLLWWNALGY